MTDLGRMLVRLEADVKKFHVDLDRAEKRNASAARKIDRDWDRTASSIKRSLGALAGALSLRELTRQMEAALDFASGIVDKADQLGIGVEAFQQLEVAAEQAGVSNDVFERSMAKLALTTVKAATEGTRQSKIFRELGVSATDANGNLRATDAVLGDLADAIVAIPDPNVRLAITKELVGEKGRAFLNFLLQGKDGIDAARQAAVELGEVLPEEIARKGEEAGDKLALLARVIRVQLSAALIDVTPLIIQAGNAMAGFASSVGAWRQQMGETRLDGHIQSLEQYLKDLDKFRPEDLNAKAAAQRNLNEALAEREQSSRGRQVQLAGMLGFDEFGNPIRSESSTRPPASDADVKRLRGLLGTTGSGSKGSSSKDKPFNLSAAGMSNSGPGHDAVVQLIKDMQKAEEGLLTFDRQMTEELLRNQEQLATTAQQQTDARIQLIKLEGAAKLQQLAEFEAHLGRTKEIEDLRAKITLDTNQKIEAESQRHAQALGDLLEPVFQTLGNAIEQFALGAELNMETFRKAIIQTLIQVAAEALRTKAALAFGLPEGSGTGTIVLKALGSLGGILSGGLAEGGLAMRPTVTAFAENEPEFAVPWSKVGPFVAAAGGGGVDIQVINTGPPINATAETERGPDGRTMVRMMVQSQVKQGLASGAFREEIPGMKHRGTLR